MKFPVVYLCMLYVVGRQVDVDAHVMLSCWPRRSKNKFQTHGCEDSDQMQCGYSVFRLCPSFFIQNRASLPVLRQKIRSHLFTCKLFSVCGSLTE